MAFGLTLEKDIEKIAERFESPVLTQKLLKAAKYLQNSYRYKDTDIYAAINGLLDELDNEYGLNDDLIWSIKNGSFTLIVQQSLIEFF